MALTWDDGDSLNDFIKKNKESLINFDSTKITSNDSRITICEMTRRIVDTLVLSGIDKTHPELFNDLINRIKYVYISAKKMQNRIVELKGESNDLFEVIDADYDVNKRIHRIKQIGNL